MQFDEADLELVEEEGVLGAVVSHEMGHVLGFGVLWGVEGLLVDPSQPPNNGDDPHFPGRRRRRGVRRGGRDALHRW